MSDFSQERGKYLVGERAMKGAPMGRSVFRLLRAARGDLMNTLHQPPLKQYGHDALPFRPTGPIGGNVR